MNYKQLLLSLYFSVLALFLSAQENVIVLNFKGTNQISDQCIIATSLVDSRDTFAVVIEANYSAMDMDVNNKGWMIRFYINLPVVAVNSMVDSFPIQQNNPVASCYFSNGDYETLSLKGYLKINELQHQIVNHNLIINSLTATYHLYNSEFQKISGTISIEN